jgi:hypothetical protein
MEMSFYVSGSERHVSNDAFSKKELPNYQEKNTVPVDSENSFSNGGVVRPFLSKFIHPTIGSEDYSHDLWFTPRWNINDLPFGKHRNGKSLTHGG